VKHNILGCNQYILSQGHEAVAVEQHPPQGVFVGEHAGLVINTFSLSATAGGHAIGWSNVSNVDGQIVSQGHEAVAVEQHPPQGVFVGEHAGLVINTFSLSATAGGHAIGWSNVSNVDGQIVSQGHEAVAVALLEAGAEVAVKDVNPKPCSSFSSLFAKSNPKT